MLKIARVADWLDVSVTINNHHNKFLPTHSSSLPPSTHGKHTLRSTRADSFTSPPDSWLPCNEKCPVGVPEDPRAHLSIQTLLVDVKNVNPRLCSIFFRISDPRPSRQGL